MPRTSLYTDPIPYNKIARVGAIGAETVFRVATTLRHHHTLLPQIASSPMLRQGSDLYTVYAMPLDDAMLIDPHCDVLTAMLARLSAFQWGVGARSYSASTHADPRAKLRRSLLYVPSSNDRMLQKSLSSPSDALIYDLEDSVAPNEKERARTALLGFLQVRSQISQPREHASRTFVRLNAIDTPQFVGDITTVLKWEHLEGIVMPKIHSASYLDKVASYVPEGRPLSIIASIESARGLWDAGHIAGWKAGQGAGNKFAAEDYGDGRESVWNTVYRHGVR
ncbi:hpcH/HpaI aldolase/citrate lyase family domain-containing protein [Rhizoctonia solani AG-1 IA]|uniref:HpcH/HpaI aldolase/citrate lyase family domain-containing protein n=1 Tax=Thanatephorus cucumeris (strain AG1-IA) TaxID=983506 RepID=L8WUD9_THACA|nr:hpcH/HpaI aldolase/citrate lyase family domain-containing protein [Rhizoctonia solani AG-1 IA]